ncbi:MAG: hypothetical protein GC152_10180 [Alphaproteobacteria bacterium]|nr:hypothetical protein [Alphaproteobacteria bacterium]
MNANSETSPSFQSPAESRDPVADIIAADEDLALTLPYLGAHLRARARATFALAIELRRIPRQVREPAIGDIRLQWWRERIDDLARSKPAPVGHPTLEALAKSGAVGPATKSLIFGAIDARERFLDPTPFRSTEEAFAAFEAAESCLLAVADDLDDVSRAAALSRVGLYAAVRWGASGDPARRGEILREAQARLAAAPSLPTAEGAPTSPLLFVALTKGYLSRSPERSWPLAKRMALFWAALRGRA